VSSTPNPLPYVTGKKLGAFLRYNDFKKKPKAQQGGPIRVPGPRAQYPTSRVDR
jgi:hypothetical protein